MRKTGKMAKNRERAKVNKGKNGGGQDGGAIHVVQIRDRGILSQSQQGP